MSLRLTVPAVPSLSSVQFFRVYSPVAFGKKTDPNGDYIRRWLPQLVSAHQLVTDVLMQDCNHLPCSQARYPAKYIYSPWEAPLSVQQASGCVVGRDYPRPIVDHAAASAQNMDRLKAAFAASRGDTADGPGSSKAGGSSSTTGKRKAGK
jgi:cryptochrome